MFALLEEKEFLNCIFQLCAANINFTSILHINYEACTILLVLLVVYVFLRLLLYKQSQVMIINNWPPCSQAPDPTPSSHQDDYHESTC
jgi:hypothetical protein